MVYWKKKIKKKKIVEVDHNEKISKGGKRNFFFENLNFENLYLRLRDLIENIQDEKFLKEKKIFNDYQGETELKYFSEIFTKLYFSFTAELTVKFFELYDKEKNLNNNLFNFINKNFTNQRQQWININKKILEEINKKYHHQRPKIKYYHKTVEPRKIKLLDETHKPQKNQDAKEIPEKYNFRCQEFINAPWYKQKTIKGFVLYGKDNPYVIPVKIYDNWYKASASFYKNSCEKKREFNKGKVGYLTFSNIVIVEDEKMYSDYLKWFENTIVDKDETQRKPTRPEIRYVDIKKKEKKSVIEKYSCDYCSKKFEKNKYNTIHKEKKKHFCDEKCFNKIIP